MGSPWNHCCLVSSRHTWLRLSSTGTKSLYRFNNVLSNSTGCFQQLSYLCFPPILHRCHPCHHSHHHRSVDISKYEDIANGSTTWSDSTTIDNDVTHTNSHHSLFDVTICDIHGVYDLLSNDGENSLSTSVGKSDFQHCHADLLRVVWNVVFRLFSLVEIVPRRSETVLPMSQIQCHHGRNDPGSSVFHSDRSTDECASIHRIGMLLLVRIVCNKLRPFSLRKMNIANRDVEYTGELEDMLVAHWRWVYRHQVESFFCCLHTCCYIPMIHRRVSLGRNVKYRNRLT